MKSSRYIFVFILFAGIFVTFFLACSDANLTAHKKSTTRRNSSGIIKIEYAHGFWIEKVNEGKKITVFNPWQGASNVSFQYILSSNHHSVKGLQDSLMYIRVPVRRIICLSTTHIAMIDFAGELNSIVGISGAQYICNSQVRQGIAEGKIRDVGYDISLNYELIMNLKPDLVLAYGVNSEVTGLYQRLKSLGIPTLFIGEYLEPDPLAKAEWVKLIACLFGKEVITSDNFSKIANEYLRLKSLALQSSEKPIVMTGLPWKEAWNVPGGKSFTSKLIMDAGGQYLWASRQTRDNIPMNIEQAVSDSKNADIWINTGIARSIMDIKSTDERLGNLRPVMRGKVYNNNAALCAGGGNSYWETGVINPQLILRDMIAIIHPEVMKSDSMVYYQKLE